jgi:hypothetical protein
MRRNDREKDRPPLFQYPKGDTLVPYGVFREAVHAVTGNEADKKLFNEKSGATMTKTREHNGFSVLLTPAALRVQLSGLVVLALVAGRLFPDFGRLLQQFSALLFR